MAHLGIVVLGSGNAFNTDGRGSPSLWIEPERGSPFLVDLGPTAIASMERLRLNPDAPDRIFFTHLHGDHVAGWPFLLLHDTFIHRRSRPLKVIGPTGTREQLERLCLGCYPEIVSGGKVTFPIEYREHPVAPASGIDAGDGIRFDVVPLEHHSTSVGYRFHLDGRTVGVSGDTQWCPAVQDLSAGCDLLVLECSSVEKQSYAHLSLEEIRSARSTLGAREILLVHVTDQVVSAFRKAPLPGVSTAEDGMRVSV
jgi:ribonuclease BN (tRNA processing enzyme)